MPTKKSLKKVNLLESFKQGGTIGRQQEFSTDPQLKTSTGYVFPYERYGSKAETQFGEYQPLEVANNFTVNFAGTQVDMPIDRDEFGNVDYTTQYNELPNVVIKPEGSFVQYRIPTNKALLNKNKEYQDQQLYVEDDSTQSQRDRLSNFIANNPNLTDRQKRIAQNKIARGRYLQYDKILGGADAWTDAEQSGVGAGQDLGEQERTYDPNYYSSIADFRETIGKPFAEGVVNTLGFIAPAGNYATNYFIGKGIKYASPYVRQGLNQLGKGINYLSKTGGPQLFRRGMQYGKDLFRQKPNYFPYNRAVLENFEQQKQYFNTYYNPNTATPQAITEGTIKAYDTPAFSSFTAPSPSQYGKLSMAADDAAKDALLKQNSPLIRARLKRQGLSNAEIDGLIAARNYQINRPRSLFIDTNPENLGYAMTRENYIGISPKIVNKPSDLASTMAHEMRHQTDLYGNLITGQESQAITNALYPSAKTSYPYLSRNPEVLARIEAVTTPMAEGVLGKNPLSFRQRANQFINTRLLKNRPKGDAELFYNNPNSRFTPEQFRRLDTPDFKSNYGGIWQQYQDLKKIMPEEDIIRLSNFLSEAQPAPQDVTTTVAMDGKKLKRINMSQSFKQGGTVGRHQDISTIKKSDIVLPGRRNIHTGEYVKPGEGIDPTTYISDALNEFDQLRTTAGQNKVVNILTNDPTLTLQEAVDQAGYGRSSWLMGLTPYAPFGKQYLPEEAIEFSRMRDYTPMELLNDEWFMSNYGDQIRAGFSGQFKGMGETLKGVGESIKDVFTTKPPVDTVGTKKEGGVHRAQDAKEYVDPMKYKPVVGNRIGARQNPDGSESTHLMAYSKVDDLGGYVAFPTLFQNEQGEFYEPENPIAEAVKKNEIYRFGNDLESAKEFAAGSWKSNMQSGGLFQNPVLSMLDRAKEMGDEMVEMELKDMLSNGTDDTFGFNFIPTDENGCEIEIVFKAQEGGYSRNQNGIISEKLEEAKDKAKSYKETMDYANNPNYVNQDQSIIGKVLDATRFILDSENNAQEYLKLEEYSNQHAQALNDYYNNLDRADKIAYNIDRVAYGNPQLRELLYNTAYMENSFGTNDKAYGRGYTHSFMSLDDPAINHIFDKREGATKYTEGQENTFKMFESLGLPTDKESFIELLDKDDPLASVAAARAYYATVPDKLPPSNDPSAMYQYFVDHYNKGGQNKYQDNEEGKARFMEGYSILDDKYNFSAPKSEYMNHNPVPFDFESYLKENPVILDFENGGTVPPEILVSPAGVFDPNYIAGEPVIVPTTRGVIAMDGVEIDLVGISDLGEIRYLPANSGNHQFRGTNIVEYPADVFYGKDGGLADWFKEEWVRIDTEGNITGPCGTMKKGKATTRCLPRKKAQSLTKAERKATARKKVRGSKKGKQFVANTRKAKVTKKDTKRG